MSDCNLMDIIRSQMVDEMEGEYGFPEGLYDAPEWIVERCFSAMWTAFDDTMMEYMAHYNEDDR